MAPEPAGQAAFAVHLDNFEGPFDLLLSLIAKHKLDVTEVALSQVTDEFIAFIRAAGGAWDLGQATEFLVVAATLLDLKAARLLPAGVVDDEEDLALLEARDLLFARLLQYRAYKEAAAYLAGLMSQEGRFYAREVTLEPRFAAAVPEVLLGIGPQQFAALAARALEPRPVPAVAVDHIHHPKVSVREQAVLLAQRLAEIGSSSFRGLVSDCRETVEVVARFLALLELYREGQVAFDQVVALGDLQVRWTGATPAKAYDSIDQYDGAPEQPAPEEAQ
jgi:segregation and condensation protein A